MDLCTSSSIDVLCVQLIVNNIQMSEEAYSESQDFRMQKPQKARYTKTSMKKKEQLIEMVTEQHYSIYRASKKLKISNSTAKSIIKNFEKLGVILQRNSKTSMMKLREQRQDQEFQKEESQKELPRGRIKQQEKEQVVASVPEDNRLPITRFLQDYQPTYPFLEFPFSFFYGPFGG